MAGAVARVEPRVVESFPQQMEVGVLYISLAFATCAHLCCCGCGEEIVTPLSPAQWSISYDGETVTLRPSVGNWSLVCGSHYSIINDQVRWHRRFSASEVAGNRAHDVQALEEHLGSSRSGALRRLVERFRSWLEGWRR